MANFDKCFKYTSAIPAGFWSLSGKNILILKDMVYFPYQRRGFVTEYIESNLKNIFQRKESLKCTPKFYV